MTSSRALGLGPSASLTGPSRETRHALNQHLCMSVLDRVQEKRGVRAKMQDVGELILFIAALGDVKLQERSISSPVPSKTSFR